jgi:transposase
MSRYRLEPTAAQAGVLLRHCADARHVWNLCVEQEACWRAGRESQALFRCVACGYAGNADVNAARNIAAGHAVKARGGDATRRPVNREPQLTLLPA